MTIAGYFIDAIFMFVSVFVGVIAGDFLNVYFFDGTHVSNPLMYMLISFVIFAYGRLRYTIEKQSKQGEKHD